LALLEAEDLLLEHLDEAVIILALLNKELALVLEVGLHVFPLFFQQISSGHHCLVLLLQLTKFL